MKNHSLLILLMAAAAVSASGAASAASFSYEGLNYTDAACTTGFTMDANGTINCSSTTPPPSATAAPDCNITQNPSFAQNGAATTIFSNCSASPNNPTTYTWSLTPLTPTAGNTSTVSSSQNYTPSTSLTPGTYTVSLSALNTIGAATGTTLSTTLTVNQPVASSDVCAASGLTRKTDLTAMNWGTGVRKVGLNLKANEAYVLSFTAPATLTTYRQIQTVYSAASKLITISSDACGFATPLNGSAKCSVQQDPTIGTTEAGPRYSLGTSASYCNLTPGQTYYVNIRNAKPNTNPIVDSCTNRAGCGFSLIY